MPVQTGKFKRLFGISDLLASAPALDRRTFWPLCAALMRASKKSAPSCYALKDGQGTYGFHEWSLRFLACARATRGPVMSVRTGPDMIRRKTMQNIAEFHIIGHIGKIEAAKEVTHISVAANYNRRDGDQWKTDPHWNRVTLFGKLRDRLAKAEKGDLVRIIGRVRQSSYEADGTTRFTVDMVADAFAILAKVSGNPADDAEE
jgi:single-strand DNA-binding protein